MNCDGWATKSLLIVNISNKNNSKFANLPWNTPFIAVILEIWKDRNDFTFNKCNVPTTWITRKAITYEWSISEKFI